MRCFIDAVCHDSLTLKGGSRLRTSLNRLSAYAAIYLLWGASYLAIRFVVQVVPPVLAAAVRYSLAGFILLLFSLCLRRDELPTWRQAANCVAIGLGMFSFGYAIIFWSETRLTSWLVSVISSTAFLWTYLGECLLLGFDRVRNKVLLPLLAGLLGMLLLVGAGLHQGERSSIVAMTGVLVGSVSWSAATLLLKKLDLPPSFVQTAGLQLSSSGMVLIGVSYSLGEWTRLPPVSQIFSYKPILGMCYLVLGGSVLAFSAFHWLIAREKASLVATSHYVNPIVAMMLGLVFAHEKRSMLQLVGAGALLGSVILVWYAQMRVAQPGRLEPESESGSTLESAA